MPLKLDLGGPVMYVKDSKNICLTADQARYIYKKVEQNSIVNVETIKQKTEDDILDKNSDNKGEENPYQNIFMNDFDRSDIIATQMEQLSIPSNVVNYVQ